MSYIGKVDMNDANIEHYSLTGSTLTVIPLTWVPVSAQSLRVTINGVVQQYVPGEPESYSVSGSNLTLGGALVATDILEVVGIESVGNIITPADNSVTTTKLADDAVTTVKILDDNVTLAKMAGGTDGNLITYDASGDPAHVATGTATHVLTSNGAGAAPTFQAAAGGNNVPQFSVYVSTTFATADNTWTIHTFDTADINDDGAGGTCFNITASGTNPRGFTVPAGQAGKYLLSYTVNQYLTAGNMEVQKSSIYKGTTGVTETEYIGNNHEDMNSTGDAVCLSGSVIVDAAVGDHFHVFTLNQCGDSSGRITGGQKWSNSSGFKLL